MCSVAFGSRFGFKQFKYTQSSWKLFVIDDVSSSIDIFLLEENHNNGKFNLKDIEGFGEKSILKLFNSIKISRNITFNRFIYSLGIRHVGQGIALIISRKFDSAEKFINYFIKDDSADKFDGVGKIILKSIRCYLEKEDNLFQINSLLFTEMKINLIILINY